MKRAITFLLVFQTIFLTNLISQQVADTSFNPLIAHPEYNFGKGPDILIDEGHNNFHTANGRYLPFAGLLRKDGYNIKGYSGEFETPHLKKNRILVIANALNKINIQNWYLPTPSAFTTREIEVVRQWVEDGGSLFLIADHMPFGGAAADLARVFGVGFTNGFAVDTSQQGPAFFYRTDNTLTSNFLTNGRNRNESVSKVVTFTGQAFRIPENATPVLRFDSRWTLLESDTAWVFNSATKRSPINGWSQGAFLMYGKGRIAVFGEAAMFTAQIAGPDNARIGMNSDYAEENYKLLLNIIHWLDRKDY
jgi:hypothetical protein